MKQLISLVGNTTPRGVALTTNLTVKDQNFVNCLFLSLENPYTGKKTIYIERRPGFGSSSTNANFTTITGFFDADGLIGTTPVIFGTKATTGVARIEIVDSLGSTSYDHANSTAITHLSEAKDSNGVDSLIWTRGSTSITDAWIYPEGGAVAQITAIPAGSVGGFAHMNGWTFVANSNGRIYNSTLNNPAAGYTDFIGADMYQDTLISVVKYKNYILGFGRRSCDWFELAENTVGSPLRWAPQHSFRIGLVPYASSKYSHTHSGDSLYWIYNGAGSGAGIYGLEGNTEPTKISTPYIDRLILENNLNQLKSGALLENKYLFLPINTTNCAVYDIKHKLWSIWQSSYLTWTTLGAFGSNRIYAALNNKQMYINTASLVYTDDSNSITRQITLMPINMDTKDLKKWEALSIIGDQATSTHNITVSWSDDDYTSFSSGRTVDMSRYNPTLWALGTSRARAFRLSDTNTTASRLESLELTIGD